MAVVAGGLSFEREVSLRSGRRVSDALTEAGYEVVELDADARMVATLQDQPCDAVFLAVHGRTGEDGTLAAIMDLLGIPMTGSPFAASRLSFDKLAAKAAMRRAGLAVPAAVPIAEAAVRDLGVGALVDRAVERLGLPLVVKPNRGGSALGVAIVHQREELPAALLGAFGYDELVLLEQYIEGRELALAVVEGVPPLPPVEIVPKQGWYDFAARYSHGAVTITVPALVDAVVSEQCMEIGRQAHRALGCRDVSRVDVIVDPSGACWVLEVNTAPGFTDTSLVPVAAAAAGMDLAALVGHLTDRALARAGGSGASGPAW